MEVLTVNPGSDILSMLDEDNKKIGVSVECKSGERRSLSSNEADVRSPDLEFNSNREIISEDVAIDYLASILVEIVLHTYHVKHKENGSNLLPGLNEGTSR